MKWVMQIKIPVKNKMTWVSIKSSGGTRYEYNTKQEAENMLRLCYGDAVVQENTRAITTEEADGIFLDKCGESVIVRP